MARIERINLEGTTYDLGPIATTTAPGMVQIGSGLSIDSNGVLSATGGGGGGSAILYGSLGENTDGAMTQKAVREALYSSDTLRSVAIGQSLGTTSASYAVGVGHGAAAEGDSSIAVGRTARAEGTCSVALGSSAHGGRATNARGFAVALGMAADAQAAYSVALGAYAVTSRTGEVDISTGARNVGFDNTNTRVIGGLHAGVLDTDAVNVAQLNAAVAGVEIPAATASTLGGVIVGSGLSVDTDGVLSANSATLYPSTGQNTDGAMTQKATTDALAGKANSADLAAVAFTGDFTDLLNTPAPYTLPTASATTLGGVKVGTGLTIEDGVLSAVGAPITIDSQLDASSSNPVANSALTPIINSKADASDIPTATSDLTNDSDFVVDANYVHTDNNFTTAEKNKLATLVPITDAEIDAICV